MPLIGLSQITITNANLPKDGDAFRFSNTTAISTNTSATGPNQTWDYTSLKATTQGLDEYKSFIKTVELHSQSLLVHPIIE